jgi:hypothetical protein
VKFVIPGRLPGLNEMNYMDRSGPYAGARAKKKLTRYCAQWAIVGRVPEFKCPITVHIVWFEPNRLRDRDNIHAGAKYILDGLQLARKIKNDSQKWVTRLTNDEQVDARNPRVEIHLTMAAA